MEKIVMRGTNTLTVQEGFDKYIRMKELKKLSPETISHYKDGFRYFSDFFDPARPCSDITRETVYESVIFSLI